MNLPSNFEDLIVEAEALDLYKKLIIQLNKDLLYANIDLELNEETLPTSLKLVLQETVYDLINTKFSDYLNLLYIIDVSEAKIRNLDGSDALRLSEDVTFMILQREWQKVWYKAKHS
ncbi:hypothetical protein [Winogradskyella pacifica]|uniref:Uncharacterized protein n=1 Tax=Winogradskyella pacifica TaxID=664642 RepID=A0A3D9MAP4_9FLAO|nr:hypothetical protein [Winogradskyella pacifica]REE16892.1 hypothetical protein DFQ09_105104 [Winogradskyella pacifica]|tara:strand:+ start:284 stop:634 length:351 start_codon:yes stop_codon:yes gene_type:complete